MIKQISILTLISLITSSCSTYNKSPVATYDNAGSDGTTVNQIVNADKKTRPIKVLRSSKKMVDGKLMAQVEIQNSSTHPIRFNYKFDWLDESGTLDSSSSSWNRSSLNGNQIISIKDVDPRGNASDFRVLFKGI